MNTIILCITDGWVTAISTFLLVILTAVIAYFAKGALYANTVSNSRPPYIDTLRRAFAALHAELQKPVDLKKIQEKISLVLYHFNQHESMGIDNDFIENCLNKLKEKAIAKQEITDIEIEKYRVWSAAILQYEWDNFKKECKKGKKLKPNEKEETKKNTINKALAEFGKSVQ